jgi:hypothetical protein
MEERETLANPLCALRGQRSRDSIVAAVKSGDPRRLLLTDGSAVAVVGSGMPDARPARLGIQWERAFLLINRALRRWLFTRSA